MTAIDTLRSYIEREVFTRQSDQRIVPETAGWIMDFRRVCLDPGFLDVFTDVFYEEFKERYPFQVGGMEVAAIPLVTAIVMKMRERGMPVNGFFIRKSRKKEGLLRMIEGKVTNDPIVLVDDLINGGYTLDRQIKALEAHGKQVSDFFSILRFRTESAYKKYQDKNLRITTLFSLSDFQKELGVNLLRTDRKVPDDAFNVKWYFRAHHPKLETVVPKSGVTQDTERLYFGSDNGILWAIRKDDGAVVWQHSIGFGSKQGKEIFSTPLVIHGRVYFGAYDGNVYCLDAETGSRIWVSFEADWIHGSIISNSVGNRIFVPVVYGLTKKSGGLLALDSITGERIWSVTLGSATRGTPVLIPKHNTISIGGEDGKLSVIRIETGDIIWSFHSGGAIQDAPVYVPESEGILFSSFDGSVYMLDVHDGSLRWKYETGMANFSSPCVWNNIVFIASLGKYLHAVDRKTGKGLWVFPARARIFSRPVVGLGSVFFGANDARLYEVDLISGEEKGFAQVSERITNPVVIDEEKSTLFLETYANEIYCLERKV